MDHVAMQEDEDAANSRMDDIIAVPAFMNKYAVLSLSVSLSVSLSLSLFLSLFLARSLVSFHFFSYLICLARIKVCQLRRIRNILDMVFRHRVRLQFVFCVRVIFGLSNLLQPSCRTDV